MRIASPAFPFASSSAYLPNRMRPMITAEVSKYVPLSASATPSKGRIVTTVLYAYAAVVPIAMRTSMFALRLRIASANPR